ncbi:hypothetical protein [Streptomyces sp. 2A115]|uniref:hypothetical protein n=1 Tax=Streptomyces sp. 2A115 TaxID=3457439 RepID=UPI003FD0ACF8
MSRLAIAPTNYTVADAVNDSLVYGLAGRDPRTVENSTHLSNSSQAGAAGAGNRAAPGRA